MMSREPIGGAMDGSTWPRSGTHEVTMSVAYPDFERLAAPTLTDIAVSR
jgi:hypothetical protein